jgi:hypothetical protein
MMRKHTLGAALLFYSAVAAFCQSPPVNDNFANRTVLSGSSISFTGTLAGATLESEEPTTSCEAPVSGGSVWWTWTATKSIPVVIVIRRDYSSFDSQNSWLEVCEGTDLTNLTQIDCNRFDGPAGRYVKFAASAGVAYQFRAFGAWAGPFALLLTAGDAPVIVVPPQNALVSPYGSAVFSVIAAGLPSPTIQWTFNGSPLPGQTTASLAVHNLLTNRAGTYSVIVSNSGGVVESFATVSIVATNPVPRLAALLPSDSTQLPFALSCQGGRWYRIESSADLSHWLFNGDVQTTNADNLFSVPSVNTNSQFVRASLNVPTDVCSAQLKQLRAARYLYAIENKQSWQGDTGFADLRPYLPDAKIPSCPEFGTYALYGYLTNDISCSLQYSRGHSVTNTP